MGNVHHDLSHGPSGFAQHAVGGGSGVGGLSRALLRRIRLPGKSKQREEQSALLHGLCLNEDNGHFFFDPEGHDLDAKAVDAWVDQYAHTQIRELMLSPNAMRTSYGSKVWNPIWKGLDPQAGPDQPLFASLPPE